MFRIGKWLTVIKVIISALRNHWFMKRRSMENVMDPKIDLCMIRFRHGLIDEPSKCTTRFKA